MTDEKALAYVNLYGVLAALENLWELDQEARRCTAGLKRPVALCFAVRGGPCATLHFSAGGCRFVPGEQGCTHKMSFSSPAAFNAMINGGKPGWPVKRPLSTLVFLSGPFTRLTNRLQAVLRPSDQALADRALFEENTLLTLYVAAGAISALANHDPIARLSAAATADGRVRLGVAGRAAVTIEVRDHRFTTVKAALEQPRAIMEFADLDLAHSLFQGTASTINELCAGRIRIAGLASMIDNINRILGRVSVYLA